MHTMWPKKSLKLTANKHIAITGSNGFIGSEIKKHLLKKGYKLSCLQRNIPAQKEKGVTYIKYELSNKNALHKLEDVTHIIHTAYQAYNIKSINADSTNIIGTSALIEYAKLKNIPITFLSTLSAHSKAKSHYGLNKLYLEGLFNLEKDCILKLGLVIGSKGLFSKIKEIINKALFIPLIGGGKQPIQTIGITDLHIVIENIISKNIKGRYNVAEEMAFPMMELYTNTADYLNKKIRFVPIPYWLIYNTCQILEFFGLELPVSSESVIGLKCLRKFETAKDIKALGVSISTFKENLKKLS